MITKSPRVFISYSHDSPEHMDRVEALADRFRREGIDAHLDQYEASPTSGWPLWMQRQIEMADYVLVVCTAIYERRFAGAEEPGKGKGVVFEGAILTQKLYDSERQPNRLVPVYFVAADEEFVPVVLRRLTHYNVGDEIGYENLYRFLTDQPAVAPSELGKLRRLPPRQRRQDFAPQDKSEGLLPVRPDGETPVEDDKGSRPTSSRERNSTSFYDGLRELLNKWFSTAALKEFLRKNYKDGEDILRRISHAASHHEFVDGVLAAMKLRGLFDFDGRLKMVGSLMSDCLDAKDEIGELAQSIQERESSSLSPLSYGAAAGEFRRFAKVLPPPKKILERQVEKDNALPALEFVKGPRSEHGEHRLAPELAQEVLLHTIHAGQLILTSIVEDRGVLEWFYRDDQMALFLKEKDWGANQMAEAIANELGLDGYLRVNVARCVLDFGRFPGVSPRDADHLHRLSVNAELGERISREQVDELLGLYHQISTAFEKAVWIKVKPEDGKPRWRQRRIIFGVHTYDKYNQAGTLRPPVSLISRSRTYDLNHTMHPGSFDRLFPDELAEFTTDRCLLAAISHSLERKRIGVADNHPYSMPDGCVEIRSQVWYFFKYLRRRFEEARSTGGMAKGSGLADEHYERVWSMLLDTTLRHTESASLRSYVHRHRVSIDDDRKDEFERYRQAYEEIAEFCNRRRPGKSGHSEIVQDYRVDPDRPSSLGIEVRKDLVWRFEDTHDDRDPRRIGWRIPVQKGDAVIQDNVRRIARLVAAGIRQYLEDDLSAKKEASELYDQSLDR